MPVFCFVLVLFVLGHRVFLKVETLTYRRKLPESSQMESRVVGVAVAVA